MTRHALDPRAWLPAMTAALCFLPRALPPAPVPRPQAGASVAMPALHGAPPAPAAQSFELVADQSSVHFLVGEAGSEFLVACPSCRGTLQLDAPAGRGTLELRLDLNSLPRDPAPRGLDVHHVLGVHRSAEVAYRGTLVATTRTDLPGVQRLLFQGLLYFGDRVVQQPMQLWQCRLPGQPLRLQGHGTVLATTFGLPVRRWLGLFPERHVVTLGLDLSWRRTRDH